MPTYDYRCKLCDHEWEVFHSITAAPVKKCPACGKAGAKRVIGAGAAILFRGSGFYQTDYRSEGYKKAAAAEAKSNGSAGKGTGGDQTAAHNTSAAAKD
jgi:putative FmdB family regulatory protein